MRPWRTRRRGPEQLSLWPDLAVPRPDAPPRAAYYACACGTYLERTADTWYCDGCGQFLAGSPERLAVYARVWGSLRAGTWPSQRGIAADLGVSAKQVNGHLARLRAEGLIPPDALTFVYHTGLREGWEFCARGAAAELAEALARPYGRTA